MHCKGLVLPGRFELPFAASETTALSIELRERIENSDLLLVEWGQCENALNIKYCTLNNARFFRASLFVRSHCTFL